MESVGIECDPLTVGQESMNYHQGAGEAIRVYTADIKKLFKESYSDEIPTL